MDLLDNGSIKQWQARIFLRIIKKLIVDGKEIPDQAHVLECIRKFYKARF